MIQDIIKEIKDAKKTPPNNLIETLINERLDLALVAYYKDLSNKFSECENALEIDTIKTARKIIR